MDASVAPGLPACQNVVTLKDIADRCGVSVATVSRALHHPERHSAATTQQILAVAEELGYDPTQSQGARRLVMRRFGKEVLNHLIALVFPPYFYRANYFADIFQGILDHLTPEGFGLLTTDCNHVTSHALPPSIGRGDVDGAIVSADPTIESAVIEKLRNSPGFQQRHIVTLITTLPDCSSVTFDARGGAYMAASHLLDLGHRHLLHFCGTYEDTPHTMHFTRAHFLDGYQQAYRDRGLDPSRYLHFTQLDPRLWRIAFRAENHPKLQAQTVTGGSKQHPLLRMLQKYPEITGILALNDPTALLIHDILRRGGLRVPEDISLVGFDDTDPLFGEDGQNILTTIQVPLRKIGREAARILINHLTGKSTDELIRLTVPTSLVVRATTAVPRG